MVDSVRQRLLKYASEHIGQAEVAKHLKVSEAKLGEWLDGKDEMPDAKLGALADLIDGLGKVS